MDDQAKAAAHKEVTRFARGQKPYDTWGNGEDVDLFLERNYVFKLPEHGELVVTEGSADNGATGLFVNGHPFAANTDPFYWQERIAEGARQIAGAERELARHLELQAKREAVFAFLADKSARATQYEAERNARRDALAQQFVGSPSAEYKFCTGVSQKLIDRVIELEDAADSVKP